MFFPNWLFFDLNIWISDYNMTDKEKIKNPTYKITKGYIKTLSYKESFKESFNNADKNGIKQLLKLPNFDYNIFEEISGISKKMIKDKLK